MNSETILDCPAAVGATKFPVRLRSPFAIVDGRLAIPDHLNPPALAGKSAVRPACWMMDIGAWIFPGAWCLEFGISLPRRVQKLRDLPVENRVENAGVRCQRPGIDKALTNQLVELAAMDVLVKKIGKSLDHRLLPLADCSFTSNPCAVNPSKNKKK